MLNRGLSALFVASVAFVATQAGAAPQNPYVKRAICRAGMSDLAIDKALAINAVEREGLRDSFESQALALGVHIPVGILNKIRALVVEAKKNSELYLKKETRDAAYEESQRIDHEISNLLVAVMRRPENAKLFDLSSAFTSSRLHVDSTDITRYVEWVRTLSLQARLSYLLIESAYKQNALTHTDTSYRTMTDAGMAFDRYQRSNTTQQHLENTKKKDLGSLTIPELQELQKKLSAERAVINERHVDNPKLPDSIEQVIEEMSQLRFEKGTHMATLMEATRSLVEPVEAALNQGKDRFKDGWNLGNLWFHGASTISVGFEKADVVRQLRAYVIRENRDRLMPATTFKELQELDAKITEINRVLGALRKEGSL